MHAIVQVSRYRGGLCPDRIVSGKVRIWQRGVITLSEGSVADAPFELTDRELELWPWQRTTTIEKTQEIIGLELESETLNRLVWLHRGWTYWLGSGVAPQLSRHHL